VHEPTQLKETLPGRQRFGRWVDRRQVVTVIAQELEVFVNSVLPALVLSQSIRGCQAQRVFADNAGQMYLVSRWT
jgi:hypothetical protein